MAERRWQPPWRRSASCSASPEVAQDLLSGGQMRLLIAGGGAGGHLYPALAVARAFRAEEPDGAVLLVGRSGGPEERLVPAAGVEQATVNVPGLRRHAPWKNSALPAPLPAPLGAGLPTPDRFPPDA